MEKQPIDDLFARKLREAELPPSAEAFNRLQSGMASTQLPVNRRRVALWWYGAAAASLLLIALFFYRNSGSTTNGATDYMAREKRVKKTSAPRPMAKIPIMAQKGDKRMPDVPVISEKKVAQTPPQTTLAATSAKRPNHYKGAEIIAVVDRPALQSGAPTTQMSESGLPKSQAVAVETPVDVALPKTFATTAVPNQQRVVVMTIELPKVNAPVIALQPAKVESTPQAQSGSLAGLFAKVKQLKNGDVLARTTPTKRPNEPRSRIGRMFEGMKESLRNETTLE